MFRFLDNGLYDDPAPDEGGGTLKEEPNILKVNVRGNETDFDLSDREKLAAELSKAGDYEIRGQEFNEEKARLQGEADTLRQQVQSLQQPKPPEKEPTFTMDDGYGTQVPDVNAKLAHEVEQLKAANVKRKRADEEIEAQDMLNEAVLATVKDKRFASGPLKELATDLTTARFISIRGRQPTQQDLTRIATEVDDILTEALTNPDNLSPKVKDAIVQNYLNDKDNTKKKTQGIPVKGSDKAPPPEPPRVVDVEKVPKQFSDDDVDIKGDIAFLEGREPE